MEPDSSLLYSLGPLASQLNPFHNLFKVNFDIFPSKGQITQIYDYDSHAGFPTKFLYAFFPSPCILSIKLLSRLLNQQINSVEC